MADGGSMNISGLLYLYSVGMDFNSLLAEAIALLFLLKQDVWETGDG